MSRNNPIAQSLTIACAAAALLGSWQPAAADATRPNIVFILVDDLRWDAFSCMGHPFVKTPNIDRVANEGALFKNFFVVHPLCSPSRANFLTGQYSHTHGVIDNRDHAALSHRLVTFPRRLREAGYETAYIGKWHMGTDDTPRPGFDRWVSFKGQGVYTNPPLNIDGQRIKVEGYMTDLLNEHAVEFVKKPHNQPFCLLLAHKAVHGPFTPAERHKDLYSEARRTPPPNVEQANRSRTTKPAIISNATNTPPPRTRIRGAAPARQGAAPNHQNTMRQQLRCLAAIDEGTGALLKALEEAKQLDNTMIVFSSDNGFFWGEHGLGDKRWAYDESIRDPLFVRYPKLVKPGTRIDAFALSIDLAPTFLELAGVKSSDTLQGHSLLPLLRGDAKGWRTSFLAEYFQEPNAPRVPSWQAVRTDRWKLISYSGHPEWDELYDLKSDPFELKNLIKDGSAHDILPQLKAELDKLRKQTGGANGTGAAMKEKG